MSMHCIEIPYIKTEVSLLVTTLKTYILMAWTLNLTGMNKMSTSVVSIAFCLRDMTCTLFFNLVTKNFCNV